jgi:2-deoxy-D-gluconate 3-dehydrogenase
LVNAGGTIARHPAVDFPSDDWDRVLRTNLDAVWLLSQRFGRVMVERGAGKIINVASLLSFSGGITVPAYTASKHAVAGLTKALANEWARSNVQVNAIAPGYFTTDNTQRLRDDPQRFKEISARIPAERWGKPSDLAGAVVFLASTASDYVNGHVLVVDGGWMAR